MVGKVTGSVAGSATLAAAGITLEGWASIAASMASIFVALLGAGVLLYRTRRESRDIVKPIPPPPGSSQQVFEAYYRALDRYNRAVDLDD